MARWQINPKNIETNKITKKIDKLLKKEKDEKIITHEKQLFENLDPLAKIVSIELDKEHNQDSHTTKRNLSLNFFKLNQHYRYNAFVCLTISIRLFDERAVDDINEVLKNENISWTFNATEKSMLEKKITVWENNAKKLLSVLNKESSFSSQMQESLAKFFYNNLQTTEAITFKHALENFIVWNQSVKPIHLDESQGEMTPLFSHGNKAK